MTRAMNQCCSTLAACRPARRLAVVVLALAGAAGCASTAPTAPRSAPYRPAAPDNGFAAIAPADPVLPPPGTAAAGADESLNEVKAMTRVRVLEPGDRLEIRLHGIPKPKELPAIIDEGGYITMPHIGQVRAAGKTGSEAERLIERLYIEQEFYRNITCTIIPPHIEFFVRGEVKQPGRYPLTRAISLLQAIALAGGYTDYARTRNVNILRGSLAIEVNLRDIERGQKAPPPIKPGDIIVVPRRRW